MKIAYVDCVAGASGDMILGALLDAGLPLEQLQTDLHALHLPGWTLQARKTPRGAITATQAVLETEEHNPHRNLAEILALVERAELPPVVMERSRKILRRIAEVEAGIHGEPVEKVHLHELAGLDTILDVVGACAGFHRLGIGAIHVSPFPLARGTTPSRHGTLPLPAPATVALLQGAPVKVLADLEAELVTPTGAAILTTLATGFGGSPAMTLRSVGYGAGSRIMNIPNVLRLLLGDTEAPLGLISESLVTLETNIDDMPAHRLAFVLERLLHEGALDATLLPMSMKKNRLGTLLSVLCRPPEADRLTEIILFETSSLGLRRQSVERISLPREIIEVETMHGSVHVKLARLGEHIKLSAEYEDCRALALAHGVGLADVERAALEAARSHAHDQGALPDEA